MIKKILTLRGKNIPWLADQIGISHQTVYNWESGKSKPSPENLVKMAKVLQYDPEKLFVLFKI